MALTIPSISNELGIHYYPKETYEEYKAKGFYNPLIEEKPEFFVGIPKEKFTKMLIEKGITPEKIYNIPLFAKEGAQLPLTTTGAKIGSKVLIPEQEVKAYAKMYSNYGISEEQIKQHLIESYKEKGLEVKFIDDKTFKSLYGSNIEYFQAGKTFFVPESSVQKFYSAVEKYGVTKEEVQKTIEETLKGKTIFLSDKDFQTTLKYTDIEKGITYNPNMVNISNYPFDLKSFFREATLYNLREQAVREVAPEYFYKGQQVTSEKTFSLELPKETMQKIVKPIEPLPKELKEYKEFYKAVVDYGTKWFGNLDIKKFIEGGYSIEEMKSIIREGQKRELIAGFVASIPMSFTGGTLFSKLPQAIQIGASAIGTYLYTKGTLEDIQKLQTGEYDIALFALKKGLEIGTMAIFGLGTKYGKAIFKEEPQLPYNLKIETGLKKEFQIKEIQHIAKPIKEEFRWEVQSRELPTETKFEYYETLPKGKIEIYYPKYEGIRYEEFIAKKDEIIPLKSIEIKEPTKGLIYEKIEVLPEKNALLYEYKFGTGKVVKDIILIKETGNEAFVRNLELTYIEPSKMKDIVKINFPYKIEEPNKDIVKFENEIRAIPGKIFNKIIGKHMHETIEGKTKFLREETIFLKNYKNVPDLFEPQIKVDAPQPRTLKEWLEIVKPKEYIEIKPTQTQTKTEMAIPKSILEKVGLSEVKSIEIPKTEPKTNLLVPMTNLKEKEEIAMPKELKKLNIMESLGKKEKIDLPKENKVEKTNFKEIINQKELNIPISLKNLKPIQISEIEKRQITINPQITQTQTKTLTITTNINVPNIKPPTLSTSTTSSPKINVPFSIGKMKGFEMKPLIKDINIKALYEYKPSVYALHYKLKIPNPSKIMKTIFRPI